MQTFESRLLTQKVTFLLKEMGHKDAKYSFGTHIRGKYSPGLAKEYYSWGVLTPSLDERLNQSHDVQVAVKALQMGEHAIEAMTSLLDLWKTYPDKSPQQIKRYVLGAKPHVAAEIDHAWQFLVDNDIIKTYSGT